MNQKVIVLAAKVANKLIALNIVADLLRQQTIEAVGSVLQPELYPDKCSQCGAINCPQCGVHTEPPIEGGESEFDQYPVCFECSLYVKPDMTTIPMENPEKDTRYVNLSKILQGHSEDPVNEGWTN